VTAAEFIATVQDAGGELYFEDTTLKLRAPKGVLTPDLRAQWPQIKPDVVRFIVRGWEMAERWEAYCAEHTTLAFCTRCAAEVQRWPWEDTSDLLCLDCARAELEDEDDPVIAEVLRTP
jgi:hypothetical protein